MKLDPNYPKDKLAMLWKDKPYTTFQDYIRDPHKLFTVDRLITIDYNQLFDLYEVTKRIIAQSGEFVIQSGNPVGSPWQFCIDSSSKGKIIEELDFIMNVNAKTLLLE